jgi:radical SAM protein with 4Fe4S-binding SPASM domain
VSIQIHCATTNVCNGRCGFCPYSSAKAMAMPKGFMDMALFRKIADEAATIPQMTSWAFSALGEPLLDQFLDERIKYVKTIRPDWEVELYTNGVFLTPERYESLKAAGLHTLSVSLNAVSQEQHEAIMGIRGKFQTVVDNLNYAIKSGGVNLLIKAVLNNDTFTRDDQMQFYLTWGIKHRPDIKFGYAQCVVERNWANQNRTIDESELGGNVLDSNECCARAVEQFSILYDGIVTPCCFRPLKTEIFGDLKTQTIREIYNSDQYVKFREAHIENRAAEYSFCDGCTRV